MLVVRKAETREPLPLTGTEQEVANIIRVTTEDLSASATSRAVRDALETKSIPRVVESFPWQEAEVNADNLSQLFDATIVNELSRVNLPRRILTSVRFDVTDPRSTEWAKTQAARLVTAVTDETRDIIRETIAQAFTQNITVYDTAKRLRNVIGLNNRQFDSYMRWQENLAQSLRDKGLTGSKFTEAFDRMSARQHQRLINQRAEMIARTEIIMAENNGQYLGWQQAVEQGYADPKSRKRWSTSTDERTCTICMPMNGMSVQWDKPYPNGVFQPPAHPNCRCSISLLEPDSELAQNQMEEAKPVDVLDNVIPTVSTLAPVLPSFLSVEDAVAAANRPGLRQSGFQYDAGDIENLNVSVQPVRFNGGEYTEVSFKLTNDAKEAVLKRIEREGARTSWDVVKGVAVVDKKQFTGSTIKFSPVPSLDDSFDRAYYVKRGTDDDFIAMGLSRGQNHGTYTRHLPDGSVVRIISNDTDLFAFDGLTRVMIPGKATANQVQEVMKKVGISANRVPTLEDIERLKVNRLISLLSPEYKTASKLNSLKDIEQRRTYIGSILRQYGVTLDDITAVIDDLGYMRFTLPPSMARQIAERANVGGFRHSMATTNVQSANEFINLIMEGHLYSSTTRFQRGINKLGLSTSRDLGTGGGDYVFLSPFKKGDWGDLNARHSHTIYFKPEAILNRTDWFAWRSDKFGVINPKLVTTHFENEDALDIANWIQELKSADGGGELMIQNLLSLEDAEFIYVPSAWRDEILEGLRIRGKRTIGGRAIEEVIVPPKGG